MRFSFKFKKAVGKRGNRVLRPEIDVRLLNGSNSQKVVALLDSGADTCFIPRSIAERLGFKLDGTPSVSKGIGGSIPVFDSQISIEFAAGHERALLRDVPVSIPSVDGENTWIILGRSVVFEFFEVSFRQAADQIVLKKAEPAP
ncbi:MAG: aspartyl protease family protein [Candidatus Micrarchaeota archaeon]